MWSTLGTGEKRAQQDRKVLCPVHLTVPTPAERGGWGQRRHPGKKSCSLREMFLEDSGCFRTPIPLPTSWLCAWEHLLAPRAGMKPSR